MKKNKNSVVVAEPVVEPLPVFEQCSSNDAAERVRFHLSQARVAGRVALAHIIEAGRELALKKQLLGYGQWRAWCNDSLDISHDTADRYIATFQKTIGAARLEQGIGVDKKILKKELEAATVGMEEKTVRQAMIEIGVIKSHASWGGKRDGAGRKAKDAPTPDEAAQKAAARAELVADEGCGLIEGLTAWALGEEDGFGSLDDAALAKAVKALGQMLARAKEIQESRRAGR